MKKDFIGYYDPTKEEIDNSWSHGIFAFDANTLLNLYRYTDETSKDFLNAITALKERIYLPYQAAFEFHNNRRIVINSLKAAYTNLSSIIAINYEKTLENQINQFKRHPVIDLEKIKALYAEFENKVKKELSKQQAVHPDLDKEDYILNEVSVLFEKATGIDFTEERLKKIYEEGQKRYADKVPPGYKDKDKQGKGERQMYGDFIIWLDLIEFCKIKKRPLIFVTDDNKEDWWVKEQEISTRPRPELIKEFYDETGIRILIYNPDQFLEYAKERNIFTTFSLKTIEEIQKVRKSDEEFNKSLDRVMQFDSFRDAIKIIHNEKKDLFKNIAPSDEFLSSYLINGIYNEPQRTLEFQKTFIEYLKRYSELRKRGDDDDEAGQLEPLPV